MRFANIFRRVEQTAAFPAAVRGQVFDLDAKALVNLDGFVLFVMPDDYVGASIIAEKAYERNVTAVLKRVLRPDHVFVDIGANLGYFTMLAAAAVGPSGRVIAFEPNPQNAQLIYASILANNFTNIDPMPFAASDRQAIHRFTTVGSNGGIVTAQAQKQHHELYVPAVVLDDVLHDTGRIDVVKIDVEAHEPFAVRGMAGLIEKHRPIIVTEFHPWALVQNNGGDPMDYLHQLVGLRYRLSVIDHSGQAIRIDAPEDVMAYHRAIGDETIQIDLLCEPM